MSPTRRHPRPPWHLRSVLRLHEHDHRNLTVSLRGHIAAATADRIGRFLSAASAEHDWADIDIDFSDVQSVTAPGALLFDLATHARSRGQRVTLHHTPPDLRARLRSLGLDHMLHYSDAHV